ncbi:MAG: sulfotransferase [Phycisphaerales bacterium]
MAETRRPDFVIIGAMKCATSTLHDQLARQSGVFMSTPKEPNFFSDDEQWAQGLCWYGSLFETAQPDDLCGESSTHYTKLPAYPDTVSRLSAHVPDAKFIYIMRDPIDRLVSQYIHEWSMRNISVPIDEAVRTHHELLDYSKYSMQIRPWLERFGHAKVLPVFFERLTNRPDAEFDRICRFLGLDDTRSWYKEAEAKNVSSQRTQRSPFRDLVLSIPALKTLRRTLLPESVRERIKSRWRMEQRPELSQEARLWVTKQLDSDIRELGQMLGIDLDCGSFSDRVVSLENAPSWVSEGFHV